jgi:flagellar biosynthesis protein FlhG
MSLATNVIELPVATRKGRNVIIVASGKGGVGKTWFAITLAHALSRAGRRVLLFDGDLGLANIDVQLGLQPEKDLGFVVAGRLTMRDVVSTVPETGFDMISGQSGSGSLATMHQSRVAALRDDLIKIAGDYDDTIIDLGAGLDQNVRMMTVGNGRCLVVCTEEPTSLTDAYAFIKVTSLEHPSTDMRIVVNMAPSKNEGMRVYETLHKVCKKFLNLSPALAGIVRRDSHVRESIRNQTALLTRHPNSTAAGDVEKIANQLIAER